MFRYCCKKGFIGLKMSEDVRTIIRTCEHCMHFKMTPQHDEMYPIMATYPLELIHLDFLSIDGKDNVWKNVLVVTDHFTRYAVLCNI